MKKMNEVVMEAIKSYTGATVKEIYDFYYNGDSGTEETCLPLSESADLYPNLQVGDVTTIAELCSGEDWNLFYPIPPRGKTTTSEHPSSSGNPAERLGYEYEVVNYDQEYNWIGYVKIKIVSIERWEDVKEFCEIHCPPCL